MYLGFREVRVQQGAFGQHQDGLIELLFLLETDRQEQVHGLLVSFVELQNRLEVLAGFLVLLELEVAHGEVEEERGVLEVPGLGPQQGPHLLHASMVLLVRVQLLDLEHRSVLVPRLQPAHRFGRLALLGLLEPEI